MDLFVICETKKRAVYIFDLFLLKLGYEVTKINKEYLDIYWRGFSIHFISESQFDLIAKGRRNLTTIYDNKFEALLDAYISKGEVTNGHVDLG